MYYTRVQTKIRRDTQGGIMVKDTSVNILKTQIHTVL